MRHGLERPKLGDLSGVAAMGGAGRHELTIGASVTVACLARDPRVIAELPAVAQAATAAVLVTGAAPSAAIFPHAACIQPSEAWRARGTA